MDFQRYIGTTLLLISSGVARGLGAKPPLPRKKILAMALPISIRGEYIKVFSMSEGSNGIVSQRPKSVYHFIVPILSE